MDTSFASSAIDASSITTTVKPFREYPHPLPSRDDIEGSLCIVCSETSQFRKLTTTHILCNDSVLELGCSYGKSTELILKQTGNRVIAIDNSNECTQSTASLCRDAVQCGRLWVKNTDILSNPAQCLNIGRGLADH